MQQTQNDDGLCIRSELGFETTLKEWREYRLRYEKRHKQEREDRLLDAYWEKKRIDEENSHLFNNNSTGTGKKRKKKKKKENNASTEKKMKDETLPADSTMTADNTVNMDAEDTVPATGSTAHHYTVSIALPGSILNNAQTATLRTYLAGQIARAAAVFSIHEVVVFDEDNSLSRSDSGELTSINKIGNANLQLVHILKYLECPQYLRKHLFGQHQDLALIGLVNPLNAPHHLLEPEVCAYREGVVLEKDGPSQDKAHVYIGLKRNVEIRGSLSAGERVTVKLKHKSQEKMLKGRIVSSDDPCKKLGYWGYRVRLAASLSTVFTECPYPEGYDLTIGTSERGSDIDTCRLPTFKHALIVFGGVQGLEASLYADKHLTADDPSLLFHSYLNTCPNQGSRTIRTEEAILITLAALRPKLITAVR